MGTGPVCAVLLHALWGVTLAGMTAVWAQGPCPTIQEGLTLSRLQNGVARLKVAWRDGSRSASHVGGPSPWPLSPSHTSRDPRLNPASVAGGLDAEAPRWVSECGRFTPSLRTAGGRRPGAVLAPWCPRQTAGHNAGSGPFGSLPPEPCWMMGHPQAKSSLTPAALCGRLQAAP